MSVDLDEIKARLQAVRERTLLLMSPLSPEAMHRQVDEIMSPPVWDLGHIAAQEELWLVRGLLGRESMFPDHEAIYDAALTPRSARGDIELLNESACLDYLAAVRTGALLALETTDLGPDAPELTRDGYVFEMIAEHEAQHTETLLQALKLLPAGSYVPPVRQPVPAVAEAPGGWTAVDGGTFTMGAPDRGFAYDCERPRHTVEIAPFEIGRHPVTNAAHAAFVADGGYARSEFWSADGWAWRRRLAVEAPLFWERDGEGGWLERDYERREPIVAERPVCHVSWFEAEAHARWAGARLPTEAEWERAAEGADADIAAGATLDQLTFAPAPSGSRPDTAARSGARQLIGDVWEWTSSSLDGYPGFRAFPYREYSEVFFDGGHRVLRGGAWATQPHAIRTTFRNWDLPQRRQIFAGIRLARDLT